MHSPFLIESPRVVHRNWWTVLPAIPSSRNRSYHALRRVWFDHTNNWPRPAEALSPAIDVPKFFVEGLEDQLTPAIFHTWTGLPGTDWAPAMLKLLGCEVDGAVHRISWSYQFTERLPNGKWSAIADVAIHWEDNSGRAIVIVEAKRRKGTVSEKDLNGERYVSMPSFALSGRRVHYTLLLDARDVDRLRSRHSNLAHVATWQDLIACQLEAIAVLNLDRAIEDHVTSAVVTRSSHLGLLPSCGKAAAIDVLSTARGTPERYSALALLTQAPSIRELLIGLDVVLTAQRGEIPAPPYDWLSEEPDSTSIQRAKKQNEHDWRQRVWHLDWNSSES